MEKNPERIQIQIHQKDGHLPILEKVFTSMKRSHSLENFNFIESGASESDKAVLLTRPQIAYLENKEGDKIGIVPYRKIPDSETANKAATRPGIEIHVCYEIAK